MKFYLGKESLINMDKMS